MATNGGAGAGDDDASAAPRPLHVVMFPWLAFGHLIPFLELAKRLAARGHAVVTFLTTPRNASRLAALPPELSAYVRVVSLPLPVVDGLPEGAESTADVPPEKVELLKKAFDGLAAPFAAFLADACAAGDREGPDRFSRRPDWVVVDFAHGWLPPIADEHQLALGLELAGARFLWALRNAGERLPEGYEARVAGRGVVETGWVPQVRVLAHAAVGAFLTHCGWGSTVECLRFGGLPMVMLPFITDQGLIARAMADRGLGVEVARDDGDDGSFGMDAVAAAVRLVMAEEEGKVFARNAREMQVALGDGERQDRYVDELAERLRRWSLS
uniref:UDP-glycosyltransferases domain-containing protein n=1 Tax=Oryza punctata TaxID=4537 RepID=A0A0E0LI96_ORYPU